jgi:phosphate transport system substrate-binding protein
VFFGATDGPMTDEQLKMAPGPIVHLPTVLGAVVPVYNIPGVTAELKFTGALLADVYLGKIKKWNDPAIAKLNPSAKLPDQAIAVVHRSDGSGTTYNFAYYLADVNADWKTKVGFNTSVQWPVGIGAKGNEGVANMTRQTDGAIGYVEYAYAKQTQMAYAGLVNKGGKTVVPSADTFQAAAANADWKNAAGYYLILTDQAGDKSWPITGASFILIYSTPPDPAATAAALKFFDWAYKNGGKMAAELDYVPLPAGLIEQVRATWKSQIKGVSVASASDAKQM